MTSCISSTSLRPADHLWHIQKSKKPYVVSTIYLDYTAFDRYGRSVPYRLLFRALGKHGSEYFKNLYRYARRQDKLVSPEYLAGHRKAMLKILAGASLILPNSGSEYRRIGFRHRLIKANMQSFPMASTREHFQLSGFRQS